MASLLHGEIMWVRILLLPPIYVYNICRSTYIHSLNTIFGVADRHVPNITICLHNGFDFCSYICYFLWNFLLKQKTVIRYNEI